MEHRVAEEEEEEGEEAKDETGEGNKRGNWFR